MTGALGLVVLGFAACWAAAVLLVLVRVERHVSDLRSDLRRVERSVRRLRGER